MFMKKLPVLSLLTLLMSSCALEMRTMPELPLVRVSYFYGSQMERYPDVDMTFTCQGDTVYAVSFDRDSCVKRRYIVNEPGIMDTLRHVIASTKMYKYKEDYYNRYALDGWWWSFSASFSDNASPEPNTATLTSHGSNDGPRNSDGLKLLRKKMKAALQTATFLNVCDDE